MEIPCIGNRAAEKQLMLVSVNKQSGHRLAILKRSNPTDFWCKKIKRSSKDESRPRRDFWKISTLRVVFSKNALTRPDRFKGGIKNSLSSTI